MAKVQFREDDEVVAFLAARGLNPNQFARDAFGDALRRLRASERADRLRNLNIRLPRPAAELVREGREER